MNEGIHPLASCAQKLEQLEQENTRLIALLEAHGIEWRQRKPIALASRQQESSRLSTAEKVALFRRLFRGRTDVYPVRWGSNQNRIRGA